MGKYTELNDTELLTLLKQDDEAAFTEIYNRYWQTLFAMGYNRCGRMDVAQDMVQDTFTSLWRNRRVAEIRSLKNYLATAIKYMVLTHWKKTGREKEREQNTGPLTASTDEEYRYKELLQFLHGEINRLPERCRLVFKYSREQGMTVQQIADAMNISPRTAETQLSKALRLLRRSLKKRISVFLAWV